MTLKGSERYLMNLTCSLNISTDLQLRLAQDCTFCGSDITRKDDIRYHDAMMIGLCGAKKYFYCPRCGRSTYHMSHELWTKRMKIYLKQQFEEEGCTSKEWIHSEIRRVLNLRKENDYDALRRS
jgi:hypothetical protein